MATLSTRSDEVVVPPNQVATLREYIDSYRCPFAGIVYRAGYLGHQPYIFAMRAGSTGYKDWIATKTLSGKPWDSFPLHERLDIPLVTSYRELLKEKINDLNDSLRRTLQEALDYHDLAIVNKGELK